MKKARRFAMPLAAVLVALLVIAAIVRQDQRPSDAASLSSDPCGAPVYKPDGTRWVCTFDDEFDGSKLDPSKWMAQTQYVSGDTHEGYACYIDDPSVISVSGGDLHLSVRKTGTPRTCQGITKPTPYIAGMVNSYQRFSQLYGRFEVRLKNTATSAPGLHEAFWLWPDDRYVKVNWPTTGEIDVAETYSLYPNLAIPWIHYGPSDISGGVKGVNTAWDCYAKRGAWNTYTLLWDREQLKILINGKTCLVNTAHPPAFTERYILNLTVALGEATNTMTSQTPIPATTLIDYVRVWK